jgi:hypothetical protein
VRRLQIHYGGRDYTVADRTREQVEAEIVAAVESGRPTWLEVAWGEGTPLPCRLLLVPGVAISVLELYTPDGGAPEEG